ncbi:hypothetical protein ACHAXT_007600 [Thalassiosira profunda]
MVVSVAIEGWTGGGSSYRNSNPRPAPRTAPPTTLLVVVAYLAHLPFPRRQIHFRKLRSPPPSPRPTMAKKCNEAALSLLVCMEKTECVLKKKKSLEECMKDPMESDPCLAVRNAYYNCKHSQLNMRTRIRGVRQY